MKIISQIVIFVLFVCGVFGSGADEVKTVSVMEGDSATLNPDLTEIHTYRHILWRFGSELMAQITEGKISYKDGPDGRFKGRLQLNSKTASLTITNMRRKHSGLYELEAVGIGDRGTTYKKFNVTVYESPNAFVVDRVEMKTESVTEGDSVTLQTDVTEPHGDELIVWRFGDEGKLIAKCDIEAKSLTKDTDERFRDRLQLDHQTGSLTITNTRSNYSGLYIVKISSSSKQTLYKRFIVTVSAPGLSPGVIVGIVVAVLAVTVAAVIYIRYRRPEREKQIESMIPDTVKREEGGCAVLQSYHEIMRGDQMLWTRVSSKESAIASMSENDKKTYWYDERYRGRLQLDPHTGSLTIRNLRKTDAGVYFLEIKSTGGTAYRKYEVILSGKVETVSVKVGDDVTLSFPGKSGDYIKWMFEEKKGFIASLKMKDDPKDNKPYIPDGRSVGRFKHRLELDTKTGSLTIKNIRTEHTGLYTVITDPGYHWKKSFNVFFDDFTETSENESVITCFLGQIQRFCGQARIEGVFGDEKDEMKTLSVMEGEPLNLNTDTAIETDDEIIVRFGASFSKRRPYITIARFSKPGDDDDFKSEERRFKDDFKSEERGFKDDFKSEERGFKDDFKSEERGFKDRLQWNLTGPFTITITDFNITHYGDYYVQITNKKKKSFKSFTFIVSSDAVKPVMKGESINLETPVTDLHDDQVLWTFGLHGTIIADTNTTRCDERFKDRVKLDETTGSLTISNSITADAGVYHLHIISSNRVRNKRFNVTVNENTEGDENISLESTHYDTVDEK